MAISTIGKMFTTEQVEEGTDVDTFVTGLSISTMRGFTATQIGSGWIMIIVSYE